MRTQILVTQKACSALKKTIENWHHQYQSIRNKLCFVSETLQEHDLDLLCITETWLLSCDVATVGASLPGSYSFLHVPRLTAAKGVELV